MGPDQLRPGRDPGLDSVSPPPRSPDRPKDQQPRSLQPADACVICLDATAEPCVLLPCEHLCYHYTCISQWLEVTPRCPLCKSTVSKVIHGPAGQQQTHEYFPSSAVPEPAGSLGSQGPNISFRYAASPLSSFQFGPARGGLRDPRPVEPAGLAFRRDVYRLMRYSMHVGANPISGYREVTRDMFRRDLGLHARVRTFLRRELRVFSWLSTPEADDLVPLHGESIYSFRDRKRAITVERLLGHILRLLQCFEIRGSDGSLEDDLTTHLGRENTRLLLHELYSFLRSPYDSLEDWDRQVQYADVTESRNEVADEGVGAPGTQNRRLEPGGRNRSSRGRRGHGYRRRIAPVSPDRTNSVKRTCVRGRDPQRLMAMQL